MGFLQELSVKKAALFIRRKFIQFWPSLWSHLSSVLRVWSRTADCRLLSQEFQHVGAATPQRCARKREPPVGRSRGRKKNWTRFLAAVNHHQFLPLLGWRRKANPILQDQRFQGAELHKKKPTEFIKTQGFHSFIYTINQRESIHIVSVIQSIHLRVFFCCFLL